MLIRTDTLEVNTDDLILVDRQENGDVLLVMENDRKVLLTGPSAQQAWSQITEHAEFLRKAEVDEIRHLYAK